jgi:hypothetical protein
MNLKTPNSVWNSGVMQEHAIGARPELLATTRKQCISVM